MRDWFSPLFFLFARADEEAAEATDSVLESGTRDDSQASRKAAYLSQQRRTTKASRAGRRHRLRRFEVDIHRSPTNLPQMDGEEK